jgi:hypothetical protein
MLSGHYAIGYLARYFAKPYTDDPASLGVPIVLEYDRN